MGDINSAEKKIADAARRQNLNQQQGNSQPFIENKKESGDLNPEKVEMGFPDQSAEDSSGDVK